MVRILVEQDVVTGEEVQGVVHDPIDANAHVNPEIAWHDANEQEHGAHSQVASQASPGSRPAGRRICM